MSRENDIAKIKKLLKGAATDSASYFKGELKKAFDAGASHLRRSDCEKDIYDFEAEAIYNAGYRVFNSAGGRVEKLASPPKKDAGHGENPCLNCDTVNIRCVDCEKRGYSERLTQRTPTGASLKLGEPKNQAEAAAILKEQFKKACNKLALIEDLIESGQMVDISPYIVEIKTEIPFKYKVIKPTVHRRNVEMCGSRESAERLIARLTVRKKT